MFEIMFWMGMLDLAESMRMAKHEQDARDAEWERKWQEHKDFMRAHDIAISIDGERERVTDIALPAPRIEQ